MVGAGFCPSVVSTLGAPVMANITHIRNIRNRNITHIRNITHSQLGVLFLLETLAQCCLALQQIASALLVLLYKTPSELREMDF